MKKIKLSLETNQAELLVLLYFFLQPWGNTFLIPLVIMSALGGLMVMKWGRLNAEDQTVIKKTFLLAACLWLPIVISLPDAIAFKRTLSTTLTYPLYILSGLYLAVSFSRNFNLNLFLKILIPMMIAWGFASILQFFSLVDWFGPIDYTGGRAHGLFSGNLMLGVVLGSLFPLVALLKKTKTDAASIFLFYFLILIISATGTRSAWLTTTLFIFVYIYLFGKNIDIKKVVIHLSIGIFLAILLIGNSGFNDRLSQSLNLLNLNSESVENATGGRLSIWTDAINLGIQHPLNGVGANNFRYGQAEVAPTNSRWIWSSTTNKDGFTHIGAAHTHQIFLEAWSNTGFVGITGLLFFYFLLFKQISAAWNKGNLVALAALLGLLAAIFPLGSHNNFYGSWMIGWLWIWIGLSQGLFFNKTIKH